MTTESNRHSRGRIGEAIALQQQGRHSEAASLLRQLHQAAPEDLIVRRMLGALELEAGRPDVAAPHLAAVVAARPEDGQTAALLGSAYRTLGNDDAAITMWRQHLSRSPGDIRARLNFIEALLHHGDVNEAHAEIGSLPPSIDSDPEAQLTLGLLLHTAEQPDVAVGYYQRSLELRPGNPLVRRNLAAALQQLGRLDEAESIYTDMLKADPQDAELLRNLGTLYKDRDNLAGALGLYGRAMRIRRRRLGRDEVAALERDPQMRLTTLHSLRLELEQLEHLREEGASVAELDRLIDDYGRVLAALHEHAPEGRRFVLPQEHYGLIGEAMQRLVHHEPAAARPDGVLNPDLDFDGIQESYRDSGPGIVVVDEFLQPGALQALRHYLHHSTVWFGYGKARGYCGSYMEDGFGCELLLQLASELRERLPELLGPHHLNQMWAYIYDQQMEGITAHADPAAINLNFWITPDEANLDPESGGLIVSRREAPREWDFDDYNNRPEVLDPYVSGDDRVVVPHRCNRMVMFNSNLVHKTDDFSFRPGFTNRRINVTMLFGWRNPG
ncbi:MAG: tetratricopeptide repeat protein [Gammaproteobacteria bacterium]|nr:MAG: tetratricopeptide repeat protein [Gammaproteobacteria bacterium]